MQKEFQAWFERVMWAHSDEIRTTCNNSLPCERHPSQSREVRLNVLDPGGLNGWMVRVLGSWLTWISADHMDVATDKRTVV